MSFSNLNNATVPPPPGYSYSTTTTNDPNFNFSIFSESSFNLGVIGDGGNGGRRYSTDKSLENITNDLFSFSNFAEPIKSKSYANSIFSTNDPVWKPILEDENTTDTLNFSLYWPADFLRHSDNNEENKKTKND